MPDREAESLFKQAQSENTSVLEVVNGFWATAEKEDLYTRLHHAYPIAWMHIPKTGSTMVEIILHTSGLCQNFPPSWHLPHIGSQMKALYQFFRENGGMGHTCGRGRIESRTLFGHTNFQTMLSKTDWTGAAVTFFRRPDQQLVSMYMYFGKREKFGPFSGMLRCCSYCQLTMLTHTGCWAGPLGRFTEHPPTVTHADVDHAIHWLQTRFAFVGIMEKWN
eukprot:224396-Amphidinium_carterae.1